MEIHIVCFVSKLRSFFVIFLLIYFARPLWRQYFIRVSNCHGSSMVTGLFPSSVFGVLVVCLASWDEWILKVKGSSQCQRSKSGCRPSTRLWSRVLSVLSGLMRVNYLPLSHDIGIILRTVCKSRRWPYVDARALRKGYVSVSDDFFILYQTQNATGWRLGCIDVH